MKKRKCYACQKFINLNSDNFNKSKRDKEGFRNICRNCRKGEHTKLYASFMYKVNNYPDVKAKYIYGIYKKLDKKYNRLFELSEKWVLDNIVNAVCSYCGFESNGIDRIDNNIGHTESNSIPCCKDCNNARMDNFTHEEFKKIGLIIKQIKTERNDTKAKPKIKS